MLERSGPADPCASCGACCHAYYVPLSGYDVWRISRALRIEPAEFVVAHSAHAAPEVGFQLCHDGDTYELALEKAGAFEPGQPCIFLEKRPDGTSRCGIYAERPAVCRCYPMKATPADVIAFRPGALCPSGAWPETEPAQPAWRAAWDVLGQQFEQYRYIVSGWNEQVALHPDRAFSMDQYLAYVMGMYDKLCPDEMPSVKSTTSPAQSR
jgi:Fe-S-cluster containining protein